MKTKRLRDWNLRNKIILHILVIGVLTAAFISYFYTKSQKDIIQSTSEQTVELISGVIEKSIFESMKSGESIKVQPVLKSISTSQNLESLRILSKKGEILVSSQEEEMGTMADEQTKKKLENFLSAGNESIRSESIIQRFRPITNEKECFSCHDHREEMIGVLEMKIDLSSITSIWQKNRFLSVIVSLAALAVLTFIILRLFEKLIKRPLLRLEGHMKKIEAGDLTAQVPVVKADEIGRLATKFNSMVTRLKDANTQIRELHSQRMEKAEHLASLGEIAAGLAHEIKNPIAGIKGALEIITKKSDDSDTNKDVFKEMLVQIDRINQIIEDLMLYAKPKDLNIRQVFLENNIENALRLAKMQIKNKEIEFDFQNSKTGLSAYLDGDKIQEVLLNLMLNSMAAIENKGKIKVGLSNQGEKTLKITVSDDGKGIRDDFISQIFQPFFTTKSEGTGLGLSICQKTIAAHGGTIEVDSEIGRGTTFTILLPFLTQSD